MDNFADNTWSCKCLNSDLYESMPELKYTCFNAANPTAATTVAVNDTTLCGNFPEVNNLRVVGSVRRGVNFKLNDANGKQCGIIQKC